MNWSWSGLAAVEPPTQRECSTPGSGTVQEGRLWRVLGTGGSPRSSRRQGARHSHGRSSRRMTSLALVSCERSNRWSQKANFDWLLYQRLAKHFAHDARVQSAIPTARTASPLIVKRLAQRATTSMPTKATSGLSLGLPPPKGWVPWREYGPT